MGKKKKTAEPKPKKFTATPFGNLKGFQAQVPAVEPLPEPQRVQRPPEALPDDDLFLREMTGVRPIRDGSGAPSTAPRKVQAAVARVEKEERKTFLDAVETLQLDVRFRDELPDDVRPLKQASTSRMRQLKRGDIRIDLELDLHGLTREEALQSLTRFIAGASNRGQKAVLVITGKGNNSPDEPVLLRAVAGWLQDKGREMVAEFSPAPRDMGGSGAFVVFLKDRGKGERKEEKNRGLPDDRS